GLEVRFRDTLQDLRAVGGDEVAGYLLDLRRGTARQLALELLPLGMHPIDKPLARQDRGGGDGDIALRFGPLLKDNAATFLHERALDERRVGELIGQGARTIAANLEQVLDDPGVAPRE